MKKSSKSLSYAMFAFFLVALPAIVFITVSNKPINTPKRAADSTSVNCSLCDINGDGCFNEVDMPGLQSCFNKPLATNPSCTRWDVNGDGKVNISDFSLCAGCACASVSPTEVPMVQIGGKVNLQGRAAAPNARWVINGRMIITSVANSSDSMGLPFTTDQSGVIGTFGVGIRPGRYSIRMKGSHTLAIVKTMDLVSGVNFVDFGTLLEGDVNDDNAVDQKDYTLVQGAFGKREGQTGYSANADFNGDKMVNILDLSMLSTNFNKKGE